MGTVLVERRGEARSPVGAPIPRIDGPAKVTGRAHYSAEIDLENVAYACVVQSTIANGKIKKIDQDEAGRADGVLSIITHENRPRLHNPEKSPYALTIETKLPLQDNVIQYAGQHVAVVVAETLEQAAYAASLLRVEYEEKEPSLDMVEDILRASSPLRHNHTDVPMQTTRGKGAKAFGSKSPDTVSIEMNLRHPGGAPQPHGDLGVDRHMAGKEPHGLRLLSGRRQREGHPLPGLRDR